MYNIIVGANKDVFCGGMESFNRDNSDNNFTNEEYMKDGVYIQEPPFVLDDNQEYLTRDYRDIILTRYPLLNKRNIPQKWRNRDWNELREAIKNGEGILWTNQQLSYMRNRRSFNTMMDILRENRVDMRVVVDATANIGGDAIGFAMEPGVKSVIAYEVKEEVFDKLNKNVELYGLENKITTINGYFDYQIPLGSLVVIDPPFERGNSSSTGTYNLSIDSMPICAVANKILEGGAGAVLITMPKEYKYNRKYADDKGQLVKAYETQKNVKIFLIRKA
jgi:predicted RNA methylase